jgi:hypothetical protein
MGGGRRRFRCAEIKILVPALIAVLLSWSIAEAATCLPSAEAVRKVQPKAWPKWTYGPNREKCWYSGEKPVFAKAPLQLTPARRASVPQPRPPAAPELDGQNSEPILRPWRWSTGGMKA